MSECYPTPFDVFKVLSYLGAPSGYSFNNTGTPTDAASYASMITWYDSRPQPTWAYITTGAGWQAYDAYFQANNSPPCVNVDTAIAAVYAAFPKKVISSASRSLNTAFQVSSTRDAFVNYSVQIAATMSLTTGQTGSVSLQTSPDGVTYSEISRGVNGNTGTLTAGVSLTQTICPPIQGMIAAGNYVKLVTSGTATASYLAGQEILL